MCIHSVYNIRMGQAIFLRYDNQGLWEEEKLVYNIAYMIYVYSIYDVCHNRCFLFFI